MIADLLRSMDRMNEWQSKYRNPHACAEVNYVHKAQAEKLEH